MAEIITNEKKKVLSCIQPSGMLTLGNYLGALKNWKNMQEEFKTRGIEIVKLETENQLKRRHKFTYEILIKDTIPPKITYNKEITITEGNQVDLLKDVQVTDNSNEQITATVSGDYNTNAPGKYNLKYLFYIFYPLHMVILYAIAMFMGG